MKARASPVISVNPVPCVVTLSVAVTMVCGELSLREDSRRGTLAFLHHVFLELGDHVDEVLPGALQGGAGALHLLATWQPEFRVVLRLALTRRLRRKVGRRPRRLRWQLRLGDLGLETGEVALQAGDFGIERGAILRHGLACPADRVLTAEA